MRFYQTKGDGRGFRPPQEMKIRHFQRGSGFNKLRVFTEEPTDAAIKEVTGNSALADFSGPDCVSR